MALRPIIGRSGRPADFRLPEENDTILAPFLGNTEREFSRSFRKARPIFRTDGHIKGSHDGTSDKTRKAHPLGRKNVRTLQAGARGLV